MNTNKKLSLIASAMFAVSVFVAAPVSAACTLQTLGECDQAGLMSLIGSLSTTTTTTTTTTPATASFGSIPAGFTFTKNLTLASKGEEVKYLQVFLNSDPTTQVAASGVGSAGKETTYFGNATKAAVKKFQTKYGITPVAGYWGSISRAKANALLAAGTTTPVTPVTPVDTGCTAGAAFSSTTGKPCTTTTPTNPTVPVTGTLSVAIASDNPAASTLISGQSIADLAHFTLSNGTNAEVKITTIELQRLGISADATLKNVYLFDGATRLTDAGSVSSGKVTFNASNGVIVIPAASAKTISVKADIDTGTNGQTVGIALSGVTSSATLAASLPLNGNLHSIANATLAIVTVNGTTNGAGAETDPMNDVRVWENQFNIGNRNVVLSRLSLKQQGSVEAKDIKNFRLLADGVEIAKADSLDSNGYVTFTMTKTLTTGNRTLKVLADVVGGSGRTLQMSLKSKADVDVKDAEYNVSITVSATATTASTTIKNGSLQVSKATDSTSGKVANNASNVSLAKYTFKAYGEPLKVETIKAKVSVGGAGGLNGATNLRNGKIYVNGSQVGSTTTITQAGVDFTTNFIIEPGTPATVEIMADIYNADTTTPYVSGSTITAGLAVTSYEKRVSGGVLAVANLNANSVTVSEGAMTVVPTSSYGNQNSVIPQTLYKVGSWDISGSATEDINLSSMEVSVAQTMFARTLTITGSTGAETVTVNVAGLGALAGIGGATDTAVATAVAAAINGQTAGTATSSGNVVTIARAASFALVATPSAAPLVATVGAVNTFDKDNLKDVYLKLIPSTGSTQDLSFKSTVTGTRDSWSTSLIVPKNGTVKVELWARVDALSSITNSKLQSTLFVTGTGALSGATVHENVGNTGIAGQVITVKNGTLNITKAASSPVSAIVDDSGTAITASYKFEAQNDSYTIEEMEVNIADTSAVSNVVLMDGSTVIATRPASATTSFSGLSIAVPANQSKTIDVQLQLTDVGAGAGTSGAALTTNIQDATAFMARSGATGVSASIDTTGVAAGNPIYVHKAYPTITGVALDSNGEKLVAGDRTLMKFTVASNGGPISWKKLVVNVTKSQANAITDGARLVDSANPGATLGVDSTLDCDDVAAPADTSCTMTFILGTEEAVSGTKTYEIKGTVGGTLALNSYIAPQISNASVSKVTSDYATIAGVATNNFVWSDSSAQGHSATTSDWTNEFLIKTFPVSQTLTVK